MFIASVFIAAVSLLVGVFARLVGRTSGERRDMLPSSLFITASVYSLMDGMGYVASFSPFARSAQSGFAIAIGALFVAIAVKHVARRGGHLGEWSYRVMQSALGLVLVVSLVPGWTYAPEINTRRVALIHAVYYEPAPTVLGYVAFGVIFGTLLAVLLRALNDWRKQLPLAGYTATAFASLAVATALDIGVSFDWSPLPYVLPEGIFVAALAFGAALVRQTVDDRLALERLRVELEARVEERTRELACRTGDLSRAERLATVGRLAAGIAHELNNPTAAIKASLDDARLELTRRGGLAELGACVDISLAAVERVTRIVRQLGAMAGGADRADGPRIGASLGVAVRAAVASARDVSRPDVTIATHVDASLWVLGMATALEEAIAAIVQNAVQAVPDGRDGVVDVRAAVADGRVVLTVRDNGVGMREDVALRAFEPFFTTKEFGRSSGLGLPVAKGLVETMGGTIAMRSIAGVGTEVTMRLVMGDAPEVSTPKRRPPELRTSTAGSATAPRPRVLLVDDDDLVRVAMRRYLGKVFEVETAATVSEGLARASLAFDAILSDVVMPDGGGQRFYLELMARDPVLAERVIFVTGGAFRGDLQEFLQSQTQPVLNKPVRLSELQAAVARLQAAAI